MQNSKSLTFKLETSIEESFRTEKIRNLFDISQGKQKNVFQVPKIDTEKDWGLGLIVGPSGSGKSTVAHKLFPDAVHNVDGNSAEWSSDKSLLDDFPGELTVEEIAKTLTLLGFSNPPAWLRPFSTLSTGEKFRVEIARLIKETQFTQNTNMLCIDEFTSTVDRTVAKATSNALRKLINQERNIQVVAVTCHYDVAKWLCPDWILDMATESLTWGEYVQRPEIKLDIQQCHRKAWKLFRHHHYLDSNLANSAQCYIATWRDKPCCFVAIMHQPHIDKRMKRVHRIVTLPDFQGLGIGSAVLNRVGEHYREQGFRFLITTSHPGFIQHLNNSDRWGCIRKPSHTGTHRGLKIEKGSFRRLTASFEFAG